MFLKAPDRYSAVCCALLLYYMKASLVLSWLSSKHKYGINKWSYAHTHTKTLFSKLIQKQEIRFSVYRWKTNAILTQPALLLNDLYEIKKKHWINRCFSLMMLCFQRIQLWWFTSAKTVNMLLQVMKQISHFQGNWTLLALPATSAICPFHVLEGSLSSKEIQSGWCMSLLLDQIPKTGLPSSKLSGCSTN